MRFADKFFSTDIFDNRVLFVCSVACLISLFFFANIFGASELLLLGIIGLAFVMATTLKFELALFLFMGALMLSATFFFTLSVAFLFSFVMIAVFISTVKFKVSDLKTWLLFPTIVFLLSTVPSYKNTAQLSRTLAESSQWLSLLAVSAIMGITLRDDKSIRRIIWMYIVFVLLSSFTTSYDAIFSSRRQFGFSGIAFIDLCGVAIVMVATSIVYEKSFRVLKSGMLFLLLIGEFLTQTRNVFITLGITVIISALLLIKDREQLSLNKRKIILFIGTLVVVVVATIAIIYVLNPDTLQRLSTRPTKILDDEVYSIGSFTSRLLIWHTAFNGFLAHPFVGIGFYSFPIASKTYSTLNPILYKLFVARLTPHETFIALFCEVGIVGVLGFSYLLTAMVRAISKSRRLLQKKNGTATTAIINNALIYILVSLFATDAWLFGNLIMLWTLVLGLFTANLNLLEKQFQGVGEQNLL